MGLGVVKIETLNFVGTVVDRVTLNISNEQCVECASMGLIFSFIRTFKRPNNIIYVPVV